MTCYLTPDPSVLASGMRAYLLSTVEGPSHTVYCSQVSKELAMGHNSPNSPHQTTESALALFPLLHHLLTCPVFRPAVVSDALIADLSAYLAASASASVSDLTGVAQFQVSLGIP